MHKFCTLTWFISFYIILYYFIIVCSIEVFFFLFFSNRYFCYLSRIILVGFKAGTCSSSTLRYLCLVNHEKCRGVHSNTDPTAATMRDDFLRDEISLNPLLPSHVYSSFILSRSCRRNHTSFTRTPGILSRRERSNNACHWEFRPFSPSGNACKKCEGAHVS